MVKSSKKQWIITSSNLYLQQRASCQPPCCSNTKVSVVISHQKPVPVLVQPANNPRTSQKAGDRGSTEVVLHWQPGELETETQACKHPSQPHSCWTRHLSRISERTNSHNDLQYWVLRMRRFQGSSLRAATDGLGRGNPSEITPSDAMDLPK